MGVGLDKRRHARAAVEITCWWDGRFALRQKVDDDKDDELQQIKKSLSFSLLF
jgi:hypothetical protein